MKPSVGQALIDKQIKKGWVRNGDRVYTPEQAAALNIQPDKVKRLPNARRTGWIDDDRNIRNKDSRIDMFTKLIKIELGEEIWPEFYFDTNRLYRLDYALPILKDGTAIKLGIEVDGGIFCKGNSGHSSGKGIQRDQQKASLLASLGWFLIRLEPRNLLSLSTLELIKKVIENGK